MANATTSAPLICDLSPIDIPKNTEDVRIIWLDAGLENSPNWLQTQTMLRDENGTLFYTDPERCIDAIKTIIDEQIIFIVSGSMCGQVLPQIHAFRTVPVIFIFCEKYYGYSQLRAQYKKIVSVYANQEALLDSVRCTIRLMQKQTLAFTIFDNKQKLIKDLSKETASFLWYRLLVDVLKLMPQDEQAKQDLFDICIEYYCNNPQQMKKIELFRKTYSSADAVKWYTAGSFLFTLLNRVLRTEDSRLLYSFRFFIIDLCTQLEYEKGKLRAQGAVLTVYRGQKMLEEELNKIRANVDLIISINGFLSASLDKAVSLAFAGQGVFYSEELQTILFEIRCDPALETVVFADITLLSSMPWEREVLFSTGAKFKIDAVVFDETISVWNIFMTATDEGSESTFEYMKMAKDETDIYTPKIYFGRLVLYELGEVTRAGEYFTMLLSKLPSDHHEDIAAIYNQIGNVHFATGEQNQALYNYERAYEVCRQHLPSDHHQTANTLINIGTIYSETGDFDQALDFYNRTLAIDEKRFPNGNGRQAQTITSIAFVYKAKGELETALFYLKKAHDMFRIVLPAQHPHMAQTLWRLGGMYKEMMQLDVALDFYQRAFDMDEHVRTPDHPQLTKNLNEIVNLLTKMGNDERAVNFCHEQLVVQITTLGNTHTRIALTMLCLGRLLREQGAEYCDQALNMLQQALEIAKASTPFDKVPASECLQEMMALCDENRQFYKSFDYCQQLLELDQTVDSNGEHPKVARILKFRNSPF